MTITVEVPLAARCAIVTEELETDLNAAYNNDYDWVFGDGYSGMRKKIRVWLCRKVLIFSIRFLLENIHGKRCAKGER